MKNRSGVYEIVNSVNGKRYIGSASCFRTRWNGHKAELRRGVHHSQHLQAAWDKYGAQAFVFKPFLVCAPCDLLYYEQRAIDAIAPEYNYAKVAGSPLGVRHTAETKARISVAGIGRIVSAETRAKISIANKGKTLSPEHRAKISAAKMGNTYNRGRRHSVEARAHMSAAQKGLIKSPEHCAAMSMAKKGKPPTERQRAAILTRPPRKPHTPETRLKMSLARIGRKFGPHSPEANEKRSASLREHWSRIRSGAA